MKVRHWGWVGAALSASLLLGASDAAAADRNSLWNLLTLKCMRHLAKAEAPIPCDYIDVSEGDDRGVAYLKAPIGQGRMLAIPTRRLRGLEDPSLLDADAPNYFAAAWTARGRLESRLRAELPRDAVAIAVDSSTTNDQDQMFFAVDCVDAGVAAALRQHTADLDDKWRRMNVELKGQTYWARRLESPDLTSSSPVKLLAQGLPEASGDLASWSLAAVGADFGGQPGFVLLALSSPAGGARASDLEDHECGILAQKP